MESETREEALYLAKIAEQAQVDTDARDYMKKVIAFKQKMNWDERSILAGSYRMKIDPLRLSLKSCIRIFNAEQKKEKNFKHLAKIHREKLQMEIKKYCLEFIDLLEGNLLNQAQTIRERIIYLRLIADHYRYLCEVTHGQEFKYFNNRCRSVYEQAFEKSELQLRNMDPLRIAVSINYAAFLYLMEMETEKAYQINSKTLNYLTENLRQAPEEDWREISKLAQLLKDYVADWESERDIQGK